MRIGTSLFLIALGAILKFAVTTSVSGVAVPTVGVILMIVGVLGLVLSLLLDTGLWRGSRATADPDRAPVDPVVHERYVERRPRV